MTVAVRASSRSWCWEGPRGRAAVRRADWAAAASTPSSSPTGHRSAWARGARGCSSLAAPRYRLGLAAAGRGRVPDRDARRRVLDVARRAAGLAAHPRSRALETVFRLRLAVVDRVFLPARAAVFRTACYGGPVWARRGPGDSAPTVFVGRRPDRPGRPWAARTIQPGGARRHATLRAALDRCGARTWRCLVGPSAGLGCATRRGRRAAPPQLLVAGARPWSGIVRAGAVGCSRRGRSCELLAIALVPARCTIAVLRHQLLDIRLVLVAHRRCTRWLIGGVLGSTSGSCRRRDACCGGWGSASVLARCDRRGFNPCGAAAARSTGRSTATAPTRARRARRMGERPGPGRPDVLARRGRRAAAAYVARRRDGVTAARGTAPGPTARGRLRSTAAKGVGELLVGRSRRQAALDRADGPRWSCSAPLAPSCTPRPCPSRAALRGADRRRPRGGARRPARGTCTTARAGADRHRLPGRRARATSWLRPGPAPALLRSCATRHRRPIDDVRRLVYALRPRRSTTRAGRACAGTSPVARRRPRASPCTAPTPGRRSRGGRGGRLPIAWRR
jgi:hypothetical protein